MHDLPRPVTPDEDPAELPVEPDRGPATPATPPSDSTVPPPSVSGWRDEPRRSG